MGTDKAGATRDQSNPGERHNYRPTPTYSKPISRISEGV